ncbi:hypothetical protein [Bradyrhizobium cenepequi]
MVLWFCGFAVGSASAAERWPKDVCSELARVERGVTAANHNKLYRALSRGPLLVLERDRCGVDVSRKEAEDNAVAEAFDKSVPEGQRPRAPVLCDTTPKAYGGSYTDCF